MCGRGSLSWISEPGGRGHHRTLEGVWKEELYCNFIIKCQIITQTLTLTQSTKQELAAFRTAYRGDRTAFFGFMDAFQRLLLTIGFPCVAIVQI